MEHIVASVIISHLENNKILYDGFRSARSCETQLISYSQNISKSNDFNVRTDIIIMDFAKAFDKVPHNTFSINLNCM